MIILENEAVLVVDKRPGYLSVLSRLGENDPRPCEFTYWQKKLGAPLWSVHRLDEEVSGLLVLAKTPRAHSELSQAFESRSIQKSYEAWTEAGEVLPAIGSTQHWESLLLRGKKRAYEKPFGKKALTEAVLIGNRERGGFSFLSWVLYPLTGRSHQLRYECFKHGFPIVGDSLYGSRFPFEVTKGIALRAVGLDFGKCSVRQSLGLPPRLEVPSILEWLSSPVNSD